MTPPQALQALQSLIDTQSAVMAINYIYLLGALLFVSAACLLWLASKPVRQYF
jgi:hypothetical protein